MTKRVMLLLSCCAICFLGAQALAEGFTSNVKIIGLDVGDTNSLYLRFDSNTECGTSLARVSNSQQYYKDMVALASTAYVSQTTIRAWVSACDSNGTATIVRLAVGTVW